MNRYYEKIVARTVGPMIASLKVQELFRPFYSGWGHILMFHRVLPKENRFRIHNHETLEISTGQLEEIIAYFEERKYDFISLDQLKDRLNHKKNKFVIFTFDDGYLDNYEIAYPIFRKHKIPFTLYITTDFPDNKALIWWYLLEELLIREKKVEIDQDVIDCSSNAGKERAFYTIRSHLISSTREEIIRFFNRYMIDAFSEERRLSMNWEQLRRLSADPLVTIGAHTITHRALLKLEPEEAKNEALASKIRIQEELKCEIKHFAYPFGSKTEAGERDFKLMADLDFETAATTRLANIFPQHINRMHALPRITINPSVNKPVLDLLCSGFIPSIRNSFKKIL
ncbi:MAG: polysaccharide deacetylase family protein [Bacteroidales bacterium]|nr:polysaccharide deacetylase family protein [Bacteroidales bacterium]